MACSKQSGYYRHDPDFHTRLGKTESFRWSDVIEWDSSKGEVTRVTKGDGSQFGIFMISLFLVLGPSWEGVRKRRVLIYPCEMSKL